MRPWSANGVTSTPAPATAFSSASTVLGSTPGMIRQLTVASRHLRQRVVGMAALEHGGDAAGAGHAGFELIGLDRVGGRAVVGVGEPGAHRVARARRVSCLARSVK